MDGILEYVIWIRAIARPHLRTSIEYRRQNYSPYPHQQQQLQQYPAARKVLLHCLDGYTDTSLLALAYIMYDRVLSLPDAYLYLQDTKNRSFFVYPQDVQLLSALERRIAEIVGKQGRARFNDDLTKEELELADRQAKVMERPAFVATAAGQMQQVQQTTANPSATMTTTATVTLGFGSALGAAARSYLQPIRPSLFSRSSSHSSTATLRGQAPLSPPSSLSSAKQPLGPTSDAFSHPWFYTDLFDGHFPSRILPFLYLGNINHANNALMLRAIGITHVLSVGECALTPPHKQNVPSGPSSPGKARLPTNSLWLEQSLGNIEVCDIQDIQDDGSDPILGHLCTALEFIERARQSNGKVLVHCRVGVSRSATLVIAYVMKFLDLGLSEAYLLVRARRLNILIQPTLLFMHCLHTWEEAIRESGTDEEGHMFLERSGRITWPVLSLELANLNKKCE
jgi:dual specificity MAP kinase phosphatase